MTVKIQYEKPIIFDLPEKPIPIANQGFPYNNIASDRRFEELIYSIYNKKILNDPTWKDLFDDIKLMQGVGESGRDCTLYKNKINNGAIQCKKYFKRITKPECIKEIIKFILFSIVDNSLLPDENNFSYFFIASSDFSGPASTYLNHFNTNIKTEPNLENWVNELIKDYITFKGLVFATLSVELISKLSKIRIIQIIPRQLDIELNTPYTQDIVSLFFNVRSVVDTKTVEEIKSLVKGLITSNQVLLSDDEIKQKFITASLQLASYKDDLYNMPGSHINRSETIEIIDWLKKQLGAKDDPVLLLTGNPGYGKSVILKDVYNQIVNAKNPVIGIKSDRYYVNSISELTTRMNLDYSIIELTKKLAETNEQVVVLIDQIDSLSQAVTTKRDYIDTYNKILHELMLIKGVRIILSIRTYDLTYDYEFTQYKGYHKVIVNPLSTVQLTSILNRLGINIEHLSVNLVALLSVPNNLDIFCKIFKHDFKINHLTTLQDLYDELWIQKIESVVDGKTEQSVNAIFEISEKLHNEQTLLISIQKLSVSTQHRLSILISMGLIILQESEVQFFHQSFHDYVFSRHFTTQKLSVLSYIQKEDQSLYIRPALKMILTFIRSKDTREYIKIINELLFSKSIRFHIQLLIINQIGFERNPSVLESDFVINKILISRKYGIPFLESAIGTKWFDIFISNKILDKLLYPNIFCFEKITKIKFIQLLLTKIGLSECLVKNDFAKRKDKEFNLWFDIIRRSLPEKRKLVMTYLVGLNDFPNKKNIILRILFSLKIWDEELAFQLFDKNYDNYENQLFEFSQVMEDAVSFNYDWCLTRFKNACLESIGKKSTNSMSAYQKILILKKLFLTNPEKTFVFAIELLREIIKSSISGLEIDPTKLYDDITFSFLDHDRDHLNEFNEMLFKNCIDNAKELSIKHSAVFDNFIVEAEYENSVSILRIILIALENEPVYYCERSFNLLMTLFKKNAFKGSLKFYIRNLITVAYHCFTDIQKNELNSLILQLKSDFEMHSYEIMGRRKFHSNYGYLQFEYLSSIPQCQISLFPEIRKKYLEFKRKYSTAENSKAFTFKSIRIGAPLAAKAYEKMSLEQWETSFLRFNKQQDYSFDSEKGGLTENCHEFEERVIKNPDYFSPLIEKIIKEQNVPPDYMIAGLNGLIKANYSPETVYDLYKLLIQIPLSGFNIRLVIWMTDYLSRNRLIDEGIFNFVCGIALDDPDPNNATNPEHPENDILNTNRGAAVDAVIRSAFNPSFGEKIFEVLSVVAKDPIISVRLSALRHLAYLTNIDKEKTLQLFLSFINNTGNKDVFKFSIDPAQHLARYDFKALIPYFKKASEIETVQGNIAIILAIAWFNKKEDSYKLLKKVWRKSSKARSTMVEVALTNYKDDDTKIRQKSKWLFEHFLNDNSEDVLHAYSSAFLHLNPLDFELYLPLIKKYSASKCAQKDPHYYYDFLLKCCKFQSKECIDLTRHFIKYNEPNPYTGPHYEGNEPVKILMGSYNGIYETLPINRLYVAKAMNRFDQMLKQRVFRNAAYQVLDSI
jgi:SpoVK/Ycf46/Vps4 family AAA+-type ATPase